MRTTNKNYSTVIGEILSKALISVTVTIINIWGKNQTKNEKGKENKLWKR